MIRSRSCSRVIVAGTYWLRCAASLCLLVCVNQVASGQTLLSTDFETDPVADGWKIDGPCPLNAWTMDQALSGSHSIRVAYDGWHGPTAESGSIFSFTFYTKGGPGQGKDTRGLRPYRFGNSSGWVRHTVAARSSCLCLAGTSDSSFYVDDVEIARINLEQANQVLYDAFAGTPAFDFSIYQSANRHQYIPNTMAKLSAGDDLKIVMLGDSIVNDTCYSFFDMHIERMYPGTDVSLVTSVRGSTGCWWYKEENRVQPYVLDHNPDLVMIGGISQYGDIDSIRTVIEQIRAGNANCEIVLMSEAVGDHNPDTHPEDLLPIDPTGTDYRDELWRLAQEQQVGFVDMTQPWAQFIANSGMDYDEFMYGSVHANYQGTVVLGRTLESYFAPVPEPATTLLLVLGAGVLLRKRRTKA